LSATCFAPILELRVAHAQDATWLARPGSGNFNTGGNWTTGTVPTGTASFAASNTTNINFSTNTALGGLTFNASAPLYSLSTSAGATTINLTGAGIVNNSSFTPSLTVTSGTTVALQNSASAPGAVFAVNSGGTLDISGLSSIGTTIGVISGAGSFVLGSKQLSVGSTGSGTVSGVIADGGLGGGIGGSLVKTGTGALTLSGANTYSGGTTINGGTMAVSSDNNLGAASGNFTFSGGILQTTATFTTSRATTMNPSSGTFNTDIGTTLTWNGDIGGAGFVAKTGGGTLILGGANTYIFGTGVNGGILQGNSASLQGNIINNASLVFDQNTNGTYNSGIISGIGSLTKRGTGTLTLRFGNSYTGDTIINAGTLAVASWHPATRSAR
jgi:autotransporter-associated beta strand protein